MRKKMINKAIINHKLLGFKKWLTLLSLMVMSLVVGISVAQAQDDPGLPPPTNSDLARKRCEAKYPEKFRQLLELENAVARKKEQIKKLENQAAIEQRQANDNEQLAKSSEDVAERARKQGDAKIAASATALAKDYRASAKRLRDSANANLKNAESLKTSLSSDEFNVRMILKDCGINQSGNEDVFKPISTPLGGDQGGNNQNGNNQANNGNNSNQGSGNAGGVTANPNDPIRIDLPNGIYKLLYKNEFEQVVKQEVYDKTGLVGRYDVTKFHPNGQPAEDTSVSYGYPSRDKHKEIYRNVKYDQNGNLVETRENTDFWDKTNQVETTTWGGGALPIKGEVITKDKNGKVKKEVYQDFGGKYGANTKIVTENGETKIYVRDENGNWVVKEDKKPTDKPTGNNQVGNKPIENNKNQIGLKCLVGNWRSESVRSDFNQWENGGAGIIMTIKADGTITVNYENMQPNVTNYSGSRFLRGTATGRIAVAENEVKIVSAGETSVRYKQINPEGKPYEGKNTIPGLGYVLMRTGTYTCNETTLKFDDKTFVTTFKKVE